MNHYKVRITNTSIISTMALIRVLGGSSVWVYTSVYMYQVLEIPLYTVGIIFTISGVLAAFVQIYGGILGDRFGYKRMMAISFLLSSTLYGLLFFFSYSGNFPLIITVVFISAQSINQLQRPSANALLALSSDKPLRSFSFLRVGANIGWGIGPAIGGFVIGYLGYPAIFAIASAIIGASSILILKLERKEPNISRKKSVRLSVLPMNFIILGISGLLLFIVQAQESVTLVNYASSIRHLQSSQLGFIYFTNGIAVLAFQGIAYKISRRISITSVFVIGALIYSVGYFTMSFDTILPMFIASMAALSFGEDFAFPMGNAIISKLYGSTDTGFYMGVYNAFLSFGRSIGPALGGFALAFLIIPQEIWLVVTLPGFASAVLFYFWFNGKLKQSDAMDETTS